MPKKLTHPANALFFECVVVSFLSFLYHTCIYVCCGCLVISLLPGWWLEWLRYVRLLAKGESAARWVKG